MEGITPTPEVWMVHQGRLLSKGCTMGKGRKRSLKVGNLTSTSSARRLRLRVSVVSHAPTMSPC